MKIFYECEYCNKTYSDYYECLTCEMSHMSYDEQIKTKLHGAGATVCDFCDHSYYVYGCERDCEYKNCDHTNDFKHFKPVDPLHDKRASGGV